MRRLAPTAEGSADRSLAGIIEERFPPFDAQRLVATPFEEETANYAKLEQGICAYMRVFLSVFALSVLGFRIDLGWLGLLPMLCPLSSCLAFFFAKRKPLTAAFLLTMHVPPPSRIKQHAAQHASQDTCLDDSSA